MSLALVRAGDLLPRNPTEGIEMTRLRRIAAALTLALTIGALGASAAAAAELKSESATTFLRGLQTTEIVFTINNRVVKCQQVEETGTFSGLAVHEHTVREQKTSCVAFGLAASLTTVGCDIDKTYLTPTKGTWETTCESGKKVVINASGVCSIEIGGQAFPGGFDVTNQGSGSSRDILLTYTMKEIKATVAGPLLVCGTNGLRENGTYTGTLTLKGYSDEALTKQVGIWVE